MWLTWKNSDILVWKPGLSQNESFQVETGEQEFSSQHGSLPFKTGEL